MFIYIRETYFEGSFIRNITSITPELRFISLSLGRIYSKKDDIFYFMS